MRATSSSLPPRLPTRLDSFQSSLLFLLLHCLALLSISGCSDNTYQPDLSIFDTDMDMAAPPVDFASQHDYAFTPPDLTGADFAGRDLARPRDLSSPIDLAKPKDLSMPVDLAKAPPNPLVWCGMNDPACSGAKAVCCYDENAFQGTCAAAAADCNQFTTAFACDDPTDCAQGDICCGGLGGARCTAIGACQDHRLCISQNQCGLGESCCPFVMGGGLSWCVKGVCP